MESVIFLVAATLAAGHVIVAVEVSQLWPLQVKG